MLKAKLFEPNLELGNVLDFVAYTPKIQYEKKPYYFVYRNGTHYPIEIGETVQGNVTRIMNFFKNFNKFGEKFKTKLLELQNRKVQAKQEI